MAPELHQEQDTHRTMAEISEIIRGIDIQAWHRWESHAVKKDLLLCNRRLEALQAARDYLLSHCSMELHEFQSFVATIEPEQLLQISGKKGKLYSSTICMDLRTYLMYIYDICAGYANGYSEWAAYI